MTPAADMSRCELCGTPLDVKSVDEFGNAARFVFTAHTPEFCRKATLARMRAMQEIVAEHVMREQGYRDSIEQMSRWLGCMSRICSAGEKWLRMGSVIDPDGVVLGLADAIEKAISQVEIQKKRIE